MNTDGDIHESEPILLTDADLDLVAGGVTVGGTAIGTQTLRINGAFS